MTDTPAHTPLPWELEVDDQSGIGRTHAVYICGEGGWPDGQLARVNVMDGLGEREANAAFIVRACNSHYLLVEALREWDAIMSTGLFNVEPERIERAREMQRTILIQATGEV